ncbi:DcaP family trimeric outer membrane transporter [Saccharophagus sp. K07]|uniref:DcaP family trimeric outer membrane transporter n=1 Tax=Saccharophagus sp. K07 TaxID=2283636 RepID=UPI001CA36255|nr:DcaP family trimeric outer membrane transporter [Saccharophagus sp. K07]
MAAASAYAQTANTTFKIGGFVKLDVISSGYDDGDLPAGNLGRDFYVPSSIPVGGENESRDIDFHAKSSRINLESKTEIDGHTIGGFVEFDFLTPSGGNERTTNAYQPQLRHAYLTYNNWLFGQSWTTFQNVAALPEVLDFIGPTDGTVFVRQAQVRYTLGPWQFSLENPETSINQTDIDDDALPDIVARYNWAADWGSLSVAGILRDLRYDGTSEGNGFDDNVTGYGVSVAGKIPLGSNGNDIRFMVTTGTGLGRYVALNAINDAAIDGDELEALDVTSAMVSYRQVWNSKWRSNISLSLLEGDDSNLIAPTQTKSTQSVRANILYSPVSKITLGAELMYAERELQNSAKGSMNRLQFSARYDL